jgi:hypothetical protein
MGRYQIIQTAKGYTVSFTDILGRESRQRFATEAEAKQWASRLYTFEQGQPVDSQGRKVTTNGMFVWAND